ncbi:MAG: putative signal transducing protein [Anaerolineales bacterium]
MHAHWMPVYTAAGQLQAQIIAGLLQSADIPARLNQESAGSVYAFTVGPLGEVEVLVPNEQLAEAQALIVEYERGELETGGQDNNHDESE